MKRVSLQLRFTPKNAKNERFSGRTCSSVDFGIPLCGIMEARVAAGYKRSRHISISFCCVAASFVSAFRKSVSLPERLLSLLPAQYKNHNQDYRCDYRCDDLQPDKAANPQEWPTDMAELAFWHASCSYFRPFHIRNRIAGEPLRMDCDCVWCIIQIVQKSMFAVMCSGIPMTTSTASSVSVTGFQSPSPLFINMEMSRYVPCVSPGASF